MKYTFPYSVDRTINNILFIFLYNMFVSLNASFVFDVFIFDTFQIELQMTFQLEFEWVKSSLTASPAFYLEI